MSYYGETFTEYIRECFKGKQKGEVFEIDIKDKDPKIVRATIKQAIEEKVKTEFKDGKFYASIIEWVI